MIGPEDHPEWIWPRADSHIVLSAPGSPELLKTFVEPGGAFSPGIGSFGVSVWLWVEAEARLVAPEQLPREAIRDRLLGGLLPICRSRWRAGALEVDQRLACDVCPDAFSPLDTLTCRVVNRGHETAAATLFVVVRSLGPAGGKVRALAYNHEVNGFLLHDRVRLLGDRPPTAAGCVSLSEDRCDISVPLQRGELPPRLSAFDADGYCSGYLAYQMELAPGGEWSAGWDLPVYPTDPACRAMAEARRLPAADRLERLADGWRQQLEQVQLTTPDPRLAECFGACLTHLLAAFHGAEPRTATLCYPLPSIREAAYTVVALDRAGLHEWTRPAVEALADNVFCGGLGPEADQPGLGLWMLAEHLALTGEWDRGERYWPAIRARVDWLRRMRETTTPIRLAPGALLPRARLHPDSSRLCDAADDGLIDGRVIWGRPRFWVNAFALLGLRSAVACAERLGHDRSAAAWASEAATLEAGLQTAAAGFGRELWDWACALWPTGARRPDEAPVHEAFERWWFANRYDERGRYHGEPRRRYLELGQAHNLLYLGMRERSMLTIEQFLRTQDAPGLYAWAEVEQSGDPAGDWTEIRGWWPKQKILPHAWVAAEMALLLRDLMVYEQGSALVIGGGVPVGWMRHSDAIGITAAPTRFGRASWQLEPAAAGAAQVLRVACDPAPPPEGYRLRLPLPPSAVVEFDGVVVREENGDWPLPTSERQIQVTIANP